MTGYGLLAFLGFWILAFGFVVALRYMSHRERMALIERGLYDPVALRSTGNGRGALRWGIAISLLGVAISLSVYPIGFMPGSGAERLPLRIGPWMLIGFLPLFFGLSLILSHYLTVDRKQRDRSTPDLPAASNRSSDRLVAAPVIEPTSTATAPVEPAAAVLASEDPFTTAPPRAERITAVISEERSSSTLTVKGSSTTESAPEAPSVADRRSPSP
ncbi:MAG: hypothetical protein HY329_08475 [Chloroflexi bacterium]|nr:hypothetical protein [Chloroflexota bacterium]